MARVNLVPLKQSGRQIESTLLTDVVSGLTQAEMIKELNVKSEPLYPTNVSEYERGKREPPLLVLLKYARLAGVSVESLIDDKMKL